MATKQEYKKAIELSNGTRVDVSKILKVSRSAVTQYVEKHSDIRELLEQKRLEMIDMAESEIFSQLNFNDPKSESSAANIRQKASQFILKNLGKNQGWVEKQETSIEHKGEQIKVIIEEKKSDGNKPSTES